MIIKIKSYKRPTFRKLLEYIQNDSKRSFRKESASFTLTHNLKGRTINEWEKQFQKNEGFRLRKRKDSVYITHEILSWHKDDAKQLSLSKMQELAEEYIKQRNPRGMYVAIPHFDKNHFHIHICASGIEYKTGKSMRLAKASLSKLKNDIQRYQIKQFPELTKSIVEHGKRDISKTSDKEYRVKFRTGRESKKDKVVAIINACYQKANSKEVFLQLLRKSGFNTYERSGKTAGVVFDNYKFRFSRLGFSEEKFQELGIINTREKQLNATRDRSSNRLINRTR
jgi:hypothetical protein